MAEYVNCGFVRSSVLSATIGNHGSNVYEWLIAYITETLGIALPEKDKKATVKQKLKEYVKHIQNKKVSEAERKFLINLFSLEKWKKLPEREKNEHAFSKCGVSLSLLVIFTLISYLIRAMNLY